ncbi:hypothetical protein [Polyangium sp. 15x6]|uniref:hypothetical protein n=1 Tax=Polyangium sp. 15x6 TaxID=3042687 RepID=UPI00249A93F8|nr:hypothetical protein [Polyangium sp. 15x6]MDI3285986.1 hypothetical protein [Polyangium sp. 15x6]
MRSRLSLLLALLATACHSASAPIPANPEPPPAVCPSLSKNPERIAVPEPIPGEVHEVFDLPDEPVLWAPAPRDPERDQYHAALLAKVGSEAGLSQRALLERARQVMTGTSGYREIDNVNVILDGKAGSVSPIDCLEWRLFQRQARRYPMVEHPTEFGAYILRGNGRVRVYFSGADRVGGKLRGEVKERVLADLGRGFQPVAHLHNHPFLFDRIPGDRMWTTEETKNNYEGGVAPSLTDVQAYRAMREHFGLQGAWVTNGLDTAHFTGAEFDVLSARE